MDTDWDGVGLYFLSFSGAVYCFEMLAFGTGRLILRIYLFHQHVHCQLKLYSNTERYKLVCDTWARKYLSIQLRRLASLLKPI